MYIAVMMFDGDGRVTKFAEFKNQADAESHVATHSRQYPQAFVAAPPAGGPRDWKVSGGRLASDPVTEPQGPVDPVLAIVRQLDAIKAALDPANAIPDDPEFSRLRE